MRGNRSQLKKLDDMKFGTSGLRGLSVDLVEVGARAYAGAFGRYLVELGKVRTGDAILIGNDLRELESRDQNDLRHRVGTPGLQGC